MTAKEIYERIDLSQLPKEKADKLRELEVKTKGFSIQNDRVDESMRNLYAQLKEKKPSALKDLKVEIEKVETKKGEEVIVKETEKVVGKKEVTQKTPTPSSSKKETITEVAKKIRKEGEEWRQALKRAGEEMRKRDDEASKQVKTELQKLIEFVKTDPNFKDFPRTYGKGRKDIDLLKDASEKALAPGRRVSKKGHMNQYGASKGGRKYTENRDNRSDREASKFPKNIFLAKGGRVHRAELMEEGGQVFVPDQILANNPNALVNTTTMNELFAKGGITSVSLFKLQDEVWDKFQFESGAEIKSTRQNRMKFSKAMDEALKARGVAKESLSKRIFEKLEDENAHTLNEFLIINDYYQPSVWPEGKKFYFDRFKENPRGGLGKDGVVDGTQKAVKTTSKGYRPHDTIKLIIIKNPNENGANNYLMIDGSDVLNGVYDSSSFKAGGNLPSGYKYIRRGDVSQVVTKKNEIIFKPKNGFFVRKEALVKAGMNDTTKMADGGEVVVPVQIDANNPDVLVQTTTMSDLFADGGSVEEKDSVYEIELFWKGLERPNRVIKRFFVTEETLDELEMRYKYDLEFDVEDEHEFEEVSDKISSLEEVEDFLKKDWENKTNTKFAKGGYVDLQAKLMKELQKLQRDLNSQRLSQYTEGDNSEEEMARQRERASKLARFNEILDLLREMESKKMAKGGVVIYKELDLNRRDGKVKKTQITTAENYREALDKIKQLESKNKNPNVRYFTGDIYEKGGFVAMYGGKKINIEADSLYAAKLKAIEEFKVPKSKQGLLSVVSNKSMANQDFRFMADGGMMAKGGYVDKYYDKKSDVEFFFKKDDKIKVLQYDNGRLKKMDATIVELYPAKQPDGTYYPFYWVVGSWDEDKKHPILYNEEELVVKHGNKIKSKYEDGGRLEAQSLEMAQNISVQIAHHATELKEALEGKTYIEPWVTSMLQRAADNLSDATHYLEGKEDNMADGGSIPEGYHQMPDGSIMADSMHMAKGGKIREFDDVLIISKNRLGMVELIFNGIYYITTPRGETFEATIDDLLKIESFKQGGDVKIGEIATLAKENNATGDQVVKKISAGADVEIEHTEDRKVAMRIALDHLKEDFNYYEKLRKAGL